MKFGMFTSGYQRLPLENALQTLRNWGMIT